VAAYKGLKTANLTRFEISSSLYFLALRLRSKSEPHQFLSWW